MKLTDRKNIRALSLLCAFIYFVSYITRINYGAVIAEMVTSTGFAKSTLSVALTGSFITYGAGQLVSGYFGDKIQPKYLISAGLITSIAMNFFIPICQNNVQMTIVWCINGLAQAFMWPPIVKLLSTLLSTEDYNKACVTVSRGSACGTIFIYLAAPVVISLFNWESVFIMCALAGIIGLAIWCKSCPVIKLSQTVKSGDSEEKGGKSGIYIPLLTSVMLAIVLQGVLRDGVTTWMPSFISETYKLSNAVSILSGVLLPLFSMLCYQITLSLYSKRIKNPFLCAAVIFTVGIVSSLLLYLFSSLSAALSVILMMILNGCMHAVNMILLCIVPPILSRNGKVSVVSGLLNSCTYLGSAIAAYLIPVVTENSGWSATLLLWLLVTLVGSLACFGCVSMSRKNAK